MQFIELQSNACPVRRSSILHMQFIEKTRHFQPLAHSSILHMQFVDPIIGIP